MGACDSGRLALHRSTAQRRSTESASRDQVLQFGRQATAPAVIARFAYPAGQTVLAIGRQPTLQRSARDPLFARQLGQCDTRFEVLPHQPKPLERTIPLRFTELGKYVRSLRGPRLP